MQLFILHSKIAENDYQFRTTKELIDKSIYFWVCSGCVAWGFFGKRPSKEGKFTVKLSQWKEQNKWLKLLNWLLVFHRQTWDCASEGAACPIVPVQSDLSERARQSVEALKGLSQPNQFQTIAVTGSDLPWQWQLAQHCASK